ncbi:MAG: hypothetical protein ACKV19_23815 [Verrucomicrobiales bacterium]
MLAALFLLLAQVAAAQYRIESNDFHEGDFQGKDAVHNWSLELTEPFNDFRILVDSPTGDVVVFLIPVGSKSTPLTAVQNKGRSYSLGIYGMSVEATQKTGKIPKGRYFVQIKPLREQSNVGAYRFQLVEPKLGDQTPLEPPPASQPPASSAATSPVAPTEPAKPGEATLAQVLAELKALQAAVKRLQAEVQSLRAESRKSGGAAKEK